MTIIRIQWQRIGGHYHCRVFSADHADRTFALNGELVFNEAEFFDARILFRGAQFVSESEINPGFSNLQGATK